MMTLNSYAIRMWFTLLPRYMTLFQRQKSAISSLLLGISIRILSCEFPRMLLGHSYFLQVKWSRIRQGVDQHGIWHWVGCLHSWEKSLGCPYQIKLASYRKNVQNIQDHSALLNDHWWALKFHWWQCACLQVIVIPSVKGHIHVFDIFPFSVRHCNDEVDRICKGLFPAKR